MTTNTKTAGSGTVFTPWWLVLIEAIVAIVIGILFLVSPGTTLIVTVRLLGFYFLITGILSIVGIFVDSSAWGWKLFSGILGILAGIVIIDHPLWATLAVPATFVWVLAVFAILIGIIGLMMSFQGAGWGNGVLGLLGILLGIALLSRTFLAAISLPLVLGVLALLGGLIALFYAFSMRSEQQAEPAPAAQMPATPEPQVAPAPVVEEPAPAAKEVDPDLQFLGLTNPGDLEKFKQSLEYLEGVGPVYAGKLSSIGIHTPLDLIKQGATPKGRNDIANRSEISGLLILEWINHVDLYRVKGVGSEYADLLEESGVDTVMELGHRIPQNLHEKMSSVNEAKNLVRKLPALDQVEDWVAQAKELPRVIEY